MKSCSKSLLVGLVALAALSACQPNDEEAPDATLASLHFEGADYGEDEEKKLAHGERLSRALNCRGCHEPDLTGKMFPPGLPFDTGIYTSNLTRALPSYSDDDIRRLLREGVHPTRETLWMMPSYLYRHLGDADMDALIAYLRSVEPKGEPQPQSSPTEALRQAFSNYPLTSKDGIKWSEEKPLPQAAEEHRFGRYLASMTCAECHGPDLAGLENFSPDLAVVASAYDEAALTALLSEGRAVDGRDIGLMGYWGKRMGSALTDKERTAVIGYIRSLAQDQASQ